MILSSNTILQSVRVVGLTTLDLDPHVHGVEHVTTRRSHQVVVPVS